MDELGLFTDRHAELAHALHYDNLQQLGEVPWHVMGLKYWSEVKEERQGRDVEKLAYFLQEAGEPLRLQYQPVASDPMRTTCAKRSRTWKRTTRAGWATTKNSPETPLELLLGAIDDAERFLAERREKRTKMKDGHIRAAWGRLREQGW